MASDRALEDVMRGSLSQYQCDCANPNATVTPKTYKQGPVVRRDAEVKQVQKWAGIEDPKGASMTRETRTALRDKVAEYQKQNGIEAKTPGELNKDTLERMRQDKSLPGGLVDSLEKVNPYYKPEGLPRVTCVVKPGEEVKPQIPKAEVQASGPTNLISPKAAEKPSLDKLGIINQDVPPEKEAEFYAGMSKKFADMVQKKSGLPETGKFDEGTVAAMKADPQFKNLAPQVDKWRSAGLIDKDGNWDQKRHAQLRVESWGVQEPAASNPLAGVKSPSASGAVMNIPYRPGTDPAPVIMNVPTDMSKPQGGNIMKLTAADSYVQGGQMDFKSSPLSVQPMFLAAKENVGPQSLEVMARAPKPEVSADMDASNRTFANRNQFTLA